MISSLRLNLSSLICIRLTHEIRQNDMHWRWGEVEVTVRVCYFTQQREVLQVDCPKMSANENVWCVSTESLSQTKWFIPTSFPFSQWKAMGTRLGSFKWLFNPRSARGRSDSPSRMYTRKCASRGERGAGGGGTQQGFTPGGFATLSNLLPFIYHFWQKRSVPLLYTFSWQTVPLSHTLFRTLHPFKLL